MIASEIYPNEIKPADIFPETNIQYSSPSLDPPTPLYPRPSRYPQILI